VNPATKSTVLLDVNGRAVEADAPAVSALDRGFLYGDGLFETLRAYHGWLFRLDRHLERLRTSARELRIADSLATEPIADRVQALVEQLAEPEAYVRVTLTRGVHSGSLELEPATSPTVAIVVRPLHPLPADLYERGVDAVIASLRQNAESPLPRHKTLNYLDKLLAKSEAREQGAYEALLLNTRGEVAEGASSNVFLVSGRRVVTPALAANILPGVTRRDVLALAAAAGYRTDERTIRPDEMFDADELFLTSSIAELLPVCALQGRRVGRGTPGEVTRALHAAYRREVQRQLDRALQKGETKP
jgi:branched-chain amino acid aminotransferase